MFELGAETLEQRSRWQGQVLSLGFHIGLIFLAVSISWVASAPKTAPEERPVITYVFAAAPLRIERSKGAAPQRAKVSTPAGEPLDKGVSASQPELMPAGFDWPAGAAPVPAGYRAKGAVVMGGLNESEGEAKGFRPEGGPGVVGTFDAAATADGSEQPAAPPAADVPAELLSAPEPLYSEEAKRLRLSGEVVLEVKLAASGRVEVLRILSAPLGYGLDEAAVQAANRVRCRPARKAGRPIDVVGRISVIFRSS